MKPIAAPITVQTGRMLRVVAVAALVSTLGAVSPPAAAQSTSPVPDRPASEPVPATAPATGAAPLRQRIELSPADRQAIERSNAEPVVAARPRDELVPTAADLTAPAIEDRQTKIQQIRTSNRISEVIVTPAIGSYSFVMTNREGRQPLSQTDLGGGLSVPKFFRWEFGAATPPSVAVPPPPPTR